MKECRIFHPKYLVLFAACGFLAFLSASCGFSVDRHLSRGEAYLQKREFHEALMEFRAAAEIDAGSAQARWGLARAHENLGDLYETIENLRQTVNLDPDKLEAKTKLGTYYLSFDPPLIRDAELLVEDVLARDDRFIEAHILKADLYAALNKPEAEILAVFDRAAAIDPTRTETYLSLSRYFMRTGNPASAEKAILTGLEKGADKSRGFLEYGRFLNYANRDGEAEARFLKAVEAAPDSVEAREAAAEFYLTQRQIEKAEQIHKQLVQLQENSVGSRIALADFYSQIARQDEAVGVLREILETAPQSARARYRLAEIYLDQEQTENVHAELERLFSVNNADFKALILRARARLLENEPDQAIKDLETVLGKDPSSKKALYFMAQARIAAGEIDQARAFAGDLKRYHPNFLHRDLLEIQLAFAGGGAGAALEAANRLLTSVERFYPNTETKARDLEDLRLRALTARGLALLALGKTGEAKSDLLQVAEQSPNSPAAAVNLAKAFEAENDSAGALRLYEKALDRNPSNFAALNGLTKTMMREGNFDQAHFRLDRAIAQSAGQAEIVSALRFLKADVFSARNDFASAESELKKAIEADAGYLPAYSSYAALLVAQNRIDEAVVQYRTAVEKQPSASIYTLLGMLGEARGDLAEAEINYRKALDLAPDSAIAANNLAWLIAENERGNLDEALRLAQAAANREQNAPEFLDTLGWIYYKKGLFSPAVEHLRKAVALDETYAQRSGTASDPSYRLRLGMALASAGDKSGARKEIALALENEENLEQKETLQAKTLLKSM